MSSNSDFPKVGICIQARLSSQRLPGKVLYGLGNTSYNSLSLMLARIQSQIKKITHPVTLYVLTTEDPCDYAIYSWCQSQGIDCFRGSTDDVLSRYFHASSQYNLSTIVRLTSDCPFIDPIEISRVLNLFFDNGADYATNSFDDSTVMDGGDVEVVSFEALSSAFDKAKLYSEREHVTHFINQPNGFKCLYLDPCLPFPYTRLTLDTPQDFIVISKIVDHFGPRKILDASMFEISDIYHSEQYYEINGLIKRNSGWESAFKKNK